MKLPFQLLALALLLAIVPWIGYRQISEMESRLIDAQVRALQITASSVARALREQDELFAKIPLRDRVEPGRDLYADALGQKPVLDGKDDEWAQMLEQSPRYGKEHIIEILSAFADDSLEFRLATGVFDDALYVFVRVLDDRVVYREVNSISVHRNDNVQMVIVGPGKEIRRYTIATIQPGEATAFLVAARDQGARALATEPRIRATWLATENGYNVEVRIPRDLVESSVGFAVSDVDNQETRALIATIGTSNVFRPEEIGTLLIPSRTLEDRLRRIVGPDSNIRILDGHGRVIAETGNLIDASGIWADLSDDSGDGLPGPVYRMLQPVYDLFMPHSDATILSERRPLDIGGHQITVVAEQNTNGVARVQRQTVAHLMSASLLLFAAGGLALYGAGWIISRRISRLGRQIEGAVDAQGRVRQGLPASSRSDEIGDLSRRFTDVVDRLRQYNTYLEDMSRRLAHELRTPVSVIRSSLDNLSMETPAGDSNVFLDRANEGVNRLANILNSMTEATRLEQSLDATDLEIFDLAGVLRGCVKGYELAWQDRQFSLSIEAEPVKVNGIPDLIAQMLDKLVSNAVEFSPPDSTIRIRLTAEDEAVVRVINDGPSLPAGMEERLFDSMVSVRDGVKSTGSHLGLGLYIARIVAEFHGGDIGAGNREDAQGVIVTVRLPIMRIIGQ